MSSRAVARIALRLSPLLLLGALASCDIEFPEQEVVLRANPSTDTIDLLFVCKGVTTPKDGDDELAKGVRAVERLLDGRREFMVVNWPLYVDFDGHVEAARERLQEAEGEDWSTLEPKEQWLLRTSQMFLAVEDHVTVEHAGLFLDPDGRLCGYQKVRVRKASELLLFLNELIRRNVLQDAEEGDLKDPFFDAATRQAWIDKAGGPTPWFDLHDGRLRVDIPMSEASGQLLKLRFLEAMTGADEDDDWVVSVMNQLFSKAQDIRFDAAGMHLVFGDSSGTLTLEPVSPHVQYSATLLDALVLRGVMPDTSMTLERARALMH